MQTGRAEYEYEVQGLDATVFIYEPLSADTFRPLAAEPVRAGRHRLILHHRHGYDGSSRTCQP